jgi:hypothetical protein
MTCNHGTHELLKLPRSNLVSETASYNSYHYVAFTIVCASYAASGRLWVSIYHLKDETVGELVQMMGSWFSHSFLDLIQI